MHGKVVVITGAASGIGLALTRECLQSGMHVVMADSAGASLLETAHALQDIAATSVFPVICDVTSLHDVEAMATKTVERFGVIDVLINNAGISGVMKPFWELSHVEIHQVLDVNLYGILNSLHCFLPLMLKQTRRSRVVNMASVYALTSGSLVAPYSMSKHAILALSESLYFDLQRYNQPVDVSVVCPSFVNTDFLRNSLDKSERGAEKLLYLAEQGTPVAEVAEKIMRGIANNSFYILPQAEVKDLCSRRVQAIVDQQEPHRHVLERISTALVEM